jgi:hypothetical protein
MKGKIINCQVKALILTYDEWMEMIKMQLNAFGKVKFENFNVALLFVSERIYNYMDDENIEFILIRDKKNIKINLEEIKKFVEIAMKKILDTETDAYKLKEETNKIIQSFYNKRGKVKKQVLEDFKGDAINWGNLECIGVEKKYVVYVGEATPYCVSLKSYIKQELEKKGYDIEVVTEW